MINWNKNGDVWTSGRLKIRKGLKRFVSAAQDPKKKKFLKPMSDGTNAEIFHGYDNNMYVFQASTLEEAKEKHEIREQN